MKDDIGEYHVEKIWLKNYPTGVQAEIDIHAYTSLVEIFEKACAKYSERPAFTNLGHCLSYQTLAQKSRAFAAFLQQLGLTPGQRVAIMLPNLLQYPIALFGILQAGLVIVSVNPLYTAKELSHQLQDSGADAIVVLANFAHIVQAALPETPTLKHIIVTELGDCLPWWKRKLVNFAVAHIKKMVPPWKLPQAISFLKALSKGKSAVFTPAVLSHENIAFLQYTGGTTGVAKGAMLTHGNMIANILQATAWMSPVMEEGKEIIVTPLPLYHIFSLLANCLTFTAKGALNVLITNPRDIPGFIRELSHFRFTGLTGVNTLFNALLNHPDFAKLDFSALKITLGGGMPVQQVVAERWQKITRKPLLEAYGLTETSPAVTINPLTLTGYNGSIGLPIPSTDISIRDDNNQEVAIGISGELCIKGPQVMQGYWQNPQETAKVFTSDGWLRTGDIARIDSEGYIYLVDRKKDMILVSGFNVYPTEIENVIASHPAVLEVGVVGEPNSVSGEIVKAVIVRRTGMTLTAQQVVDFCRQQLTGYKIPKKIEFRESLPKTNVGKILRRELRSGASK